MSNGYRKRLLAYTLPMGNNGKQMAMRSGGSATITKDTVERLERAKEELALPGQRGPSWAAVARSIGEGKSFEVIVSKIKKGTKRNLDYGSVRKFSRALKKSAEELFPDSAHPTKQGATSSEVMAKVCRPHAHTSEIGEPQEMPVDDAEIDDLIAEAEIPGRHNHRDCLAVKDFTRTITVHPRGHAGAVDLIRALLDIASMVRLADEGPATPEKMMAQIAKAADAAHPLHDARTPEEAIGQLLKTGKGKSGPISKPKIPVKPSK